MPTGSELLKSIDRATRDAKFTVDGKESLSRDQRMTRVFVFVCGMLLGGAIIAGVYATGQPKHTCAWRGDTYQEGESRITNAREFVCVSEVSAWKMTPEVRTAH